MLSYGGHLGERTSFALLTKWKEPAGFLRTIQTESQDGKERSYLCEAVLVGKGATSWLEGTPPPTFFRRPGVIFPPKYLTMKVKKNPGWCKMKKKSSVLTCASHLVGRPEEDQLYEKPIVRGAQSRLPGLTTEVLSL